MSLSFFVFLPDQLNFLVKLIRSEAERFLALNAACDNLVIRFDILAQSNDFKIETVLNLCGFLTELFD